MSRAMCVAVVFMVAFGGVQANQYSNGGACPSDSKPEHVLSLLQTKLQMTALEDGDCEQSYLKELPSISLERRSIYAGQAGSISATLLNREVCKELHSIEVDNSIASRGANSVAKSVGKQSIKVVFFNIERGHHWKESLDHLRGANIIMLNEVDSGMARTGNINVARKLALELGKNYVQAVEFVELSNGLPEEIRSTANISNKKGFHCNAILSDFPLSKSSISRFSGEDMWFKAPTQSKTEVRLGSRMLLLSHVIVGGQPLWIAVTHLDGTDDQFDASVKAVSQDSVSGPMIYAGDTHTSMDDMQRRFDGTGLKFGANSAVLRTPTYGWFADGGKVKSKGRDHTHLVGARGVNISNMDIQAPIGPEGELLSDSAFVAFRVDA